MLALPPAPTPSRPRLLLIGTALASSAAVALFAGMIGVYLHVRSAAGGTTATWLPKGTTVPEVAANMMLIGMIASTITAQWAVYAIARGTRRDAVVALLVTVAFGIMTLNAQVYVYQQMKIGVGASTYGPLFYAITGTWLAALVAGILFALSAVFRSLGGRFTAKRHEGVAAVALYWHTLTATFVAVWFVIYVWK
jgi:heme/copper-type cytochrome/quinol oxidase subunit 3